MDDRDRGVSRQPSEHQESGDAALRGSVACAGGSDAQAVGIRSSPVLWIGSDLECINWAPARLRDVADADGPLRRGRGSTAIDDGRHDDGPDVIETRL